MKTVDLNLFKENLEIFESNQDKNKARGKITETVFYPIPSIKTRVDSGNQKKFGLSNISRLIIFFASFNLSIIFKGVHGNAGKTRELAIPTLRMKKIYDNIIIGCGITGLTIAKLLSIKNIDYLIIDKNSSPGGENLNR